MMWIQANYEKGEWKSRTNQELDEMSKGENIVRWIKGQRISWLGHLERMEEDRMSKKIFTQELEGTRRRGRPRKGWKEEAERDQVLGVRRWRELVADRKKWKDIVRQAKAHSGLWGQWRRRRRRSEFSIGTCITNKVKWSRYRPGVAQRVGRGTALLFHDRGTRRG